MGERTHSLNMEGLAMSGRRPTFRRHSSSEEPVSLLTAASYDPLPVGGIAVALMLGTYSLLQLTPSVPLLVLAACGTTLVYLVDRAAGVSPEDRYNSPGRVAWVRTNRTYLWGVAGGAGVLGMAMVPFLRPSTLAVGTILGGIGLAYGVPVLPGGQRLKALGVVKPFLVAIPWAVGAVVLPVVEAKGAVSLGAVALTLYRVCWILPNVLLDEWGDRGGDAAVGLQTVDPSGGAGRLRERASFWAGGGFLGALVWVGWGGASVLLLVDAVGLLFLLCGVWMLRPDRYPRHALVADLLVAWPIVTAVAGWMRV